MGRWLKAGHVTVTKATMDRKGIVEGNYQRLRKAWQSDWIIGLSINTNVVRCDDKFKICPTG